MTMAIITTMMMMMMMMTMMTIMVTMMMMTMMMMFNYRALRFRDGIRMIHGQRHSQPSRQRLLIPQRNHTRNRHQNQRNRFPKNHHRGMDGLRGERLTDSYPIRKGLAGAYSIGENVAN